jgi:DNA-binding NarL/FixJ family response regulator
MMTPVTTETAGNEVREKPSKTAARRAERAQAPGTLAAPYLLAVSICTTLIANGGPGWLNILVLLFIWNTMKLVIMGPVSLVLLVRVRAQEAAARHFDAALAMHARMGARPFLARTQHAYAAMLLERRRASDLPRARTLLKEAVAAFDEIGMVQDAAAARALLARSRAAALAPPRPAYPDGLSEREVEVLRLVAAGKGNQEIADNLVISRNTVLRHVNNIYAKTAAANRVALANYAHSHRLTA